MICAGRGRVKRSHPRHILEYYAGVMRPERWTVMPMNGSEPQIEKYWLS